MTKRFRRLSAIIVTSAFMTNGAWAALEQTTQQASFGSALFGPASTTINIDPNPALAPDQGIVIITTTDPVAASNIAQFTFTVTNGVFAAPASLSDVTVTGQTGTGNVQITGPTSGGQVGQNTVTYRVDTTPTSGIGANGQIRFTTPALTGVDLSSPRTATSPGSAVLISTAINPISGSGINSWP
jgi:hypothetical protein